MKINLKKMKDTTTPAERFTEAVYGDVEHVLIKSPFFKGHETITKLLDTLREIEAAIIYYRLNECKTYAEISKIIGRSIERTRQIEAKALRKLRHPYRFRLFLNYEPMPFKQLVQMQYTDDDNIKEVIKENLTDMLSFYEILSLYHKQCDSDVLGFYEPYKHYKYALDFINGKLKELDETSKISGEPNYDMTITEDLDLSVRAYACLKRAGILTLGQIIEAYNNGRLIRVRNLGVKSLAEIEEVIKPYLED